MLAWLATIEGALEFNKTWNLVLRRQVLLNRLLCLRLLGHVEVDIVDQVLTFDTLGSTFVEEGSLVATIRRCLRLLEIYELKRSHRTRAHIVRTTLLIGARQWCGFF